MVDDCYHNKLNLQIWNLPVTKAQRLDSLVSPEAMHTVI